MGELWWDDEDAAHIRGRSAYYPGADGIESDWTIEAAAELHRVVRDPEMTETAEQARVARRARHEAIPAGVAQEEAEADIAEKASALDMPLHLRIARRVAREELHAR